MTIPNAKNNNNNNNVVYHFYQLLTSLTQQQNESRASQQATPLVRIPHMRAWQPSSLLFGHIIITLIMVCAYTRFNVPNNSYASQLASTISLQQVRLVLFQSSAFPVRRLRIASILRTYYILLLLSAQASELSFSLLPLVSNLRILHICRLRQSLVLIIYYDRFHYGESIYTLQSYTLAYTHVLHSLLV